MKLKILVLGPILLGNFVYACPDCREGDKSEVSIDFSQSNRPSPNTSNMKIQHYDEKEMKSDCQAGSEMACDLLDSLIKPDEKRKPAEKPKSNKKENKPKTP